MGMTFDEALDHLYTYSSTLGSGQTTQDEHEEAKKVAIATMRKYQKIQEIIKDWEDGRFSDDVGCLRVKVVLEDDNSVVDNSSMRSDPGNTEHCTDSGAGKEQQKPRECLLRIY